MTVGSSEGNDSRRWKWAMVVVGSVLHSFINIQKSGGNGG